MHLALGLLTSADIRRLSVARVSEERVLFRQRPVANGLYDLRMGPSDRSAECETCSGDLVSCQGHAGHIELAYPIVHPLFRDVVRALLEHACLGCNSARMLDVACICGVALPHCCMPVRGAGAGSDAGGALMCMCGSSFPHCFEPCARPLRECRECGAAMPRRITMGEIHVDVEYWDDGPKKKSAKAPVAEDGLPLEPPRREGAEALRREGALNEKRFPHGGTPKVALLGATLETILGRYDVRLARSLGVAQPSALIMTALLVPPPCTRPMLIANGSLNDDSRSGDALTTHLGSVLRASTALQTLIDDGAAWHARVSATLAMARAVAGFMDASTLAPSTARSGAATHAESARAMGVWQRLTGKKGRVRGNLMGKRGDHCARSVIVGDPTLPLDGLGVPEKIAFKNTKKRRVYALNAEQLREAVRRGPGVAGGATSILRHGEIIDLHNVEEAGRRALAASLTSEDEVERHLVDGDIVVFNRQPSLHKASIMAHHVRILKGLPFRINTSVTKPYNADFDGDEMNMHVPQTLETEAEALTLFSVETQLLAPASFKPAMGVVQDSLVGMYLLTQRSTFFDRADAMHVAASLAFETDAPADFRLPEPAVVWPRELWTGKQLASLIFPASLHYERRSDAYEAAGSLPSDPGDDRVLVRDGALLSGVLSAATLGATSRSIVDHVARSSSNRAACRLIDDAQRVARAFLELHSFSCGIGDATPSRAVLQEVDRRIDAALAKSSRETEDFLFGRVPKPAFEAKITNTLNAVRDDVGNYVCATVPRTNAFRAMSEAGSKGSALNISQIMACVGQQNVEGKRIAALFQQRTLPHTTRFDYGAAARGFVANSYVRGLDPSEFFFHAMGGREGCIDTAMKTGETGYMQRRLIKFCEDLRIEQDGTVRDSEKRVYQFLYNGDGADSTWLQYEPITLASMEIEKFVFKWPDDFALLGNVDEEKALHLVALLNQEADTLLETRTRLRCSGTTSAALPLPLRRLIEEARCEARRSSADSVEDKPSIEHIAARRARLVNLVSLSNEMAVDTLRSELATKRVLADYRISCCAFDDLCTALEDAWFRSRVAPGEMIGALAAQSIGEPATQLVLNTFHKAGVLNATTSGVPRLKELMAASASIKTPVVRVPGNKETAAALRRVRLRDLVEATEVCYDPLRSADGSPQHTRTPDGSWFIEDSLADVELSPWLLRVVFARGVFSRLAALDDMQSCRLSSLDIMAAMRPSVEAFAIEHGGLRKNCALFSSHGWHNDLDTLVDDEQLVVHVRCDIRHAPRPASAASSSKRAAARTPADMPKCMQQLATLLVDAEKGVLVRGLSCATGCDVDAPSKSISVHGTTLDAVRAWLGFRPHTKENDAMGASLWLACTSNDPRDVARTLGIEAARATLLSELTTVIGGDATSANSRHTALLADAMTQRGVLTPVTRHGAAALGRGALAQATFEQPVPVLLGAALAGKEDPLESVSARIIAGSLARIGTAGPFDVLLDTDALLRSEACYENDYVSAIELVEAEREFCGALPACPATPSIVGHYDKAPSTPLWGGDSVEMNDSDDDEWPHLSACPASPLSAFVDGAVGMGPGAYAAGYDPTAPAMGTVGLRTKSLNSFSLLNSWPAHESNGNGNGAVSSSSLNSEFSDEFLMARRKRLIVAAQ